MDSITAKKVEKEALDMLKKDTYFLEHLAKLLPINKEFSNLGNMLANLSINIRIDPAGFESVVCSCCGFNLFSFNTSCFLGCCGIYIASNYSGYFVEFRSTIELVYKIIKLYPRRGIIMYTAVSGQYFLDELKNNWKQIGEFYNPNSGNTVMIFTRSIYGR